MGGTAVWETKVRAVCSVSCRDPIPWNAHLLGSKHSRLVRLATAAKAAARFAPLAEFEAAERAEVDAAASNSYHGSRESSWLRSAADSSSERFSALWAQWKA